MVLPMTDLLRSYLTERQQIVEFAGFLLKSLEIKTGFPQGSVLRPFNFSIYINDVSVSTILFNMIMYADDNTLFCDHKQYLKFRNYIECRSNYLNFNH